MPTVVTSITREHVEHFLADMFERVKPATVAKHYRSLQQLFRFLIDDGEITNNPMERMSPPSVPEQPVPILTDAELVALIAACKGQSLENRRDEAVIRLFIDTGIRASELVGLTLQDVDLSQQLALVMGKWPWPERAVRYQDHRRAQTVSEGPTAASPGNGYPCVVAGP